MCVYIGKIVDADVQMYVYKCISVCMRTDEMIIIIIMMMMIPHTGRKACMCL